MEEVQYILFLGGGGGGGGSVRYGVELHFLLDLNPLQLPLEFLPTLPRHFADFFHVCFEKNIDLVGQG